jgi:universal stress protein E
MRQIKTILVAVAHDNTESRVLEAVRTLAAQLGAEVVLVNVLELEPEHETLVEKEAFHAAMTSWLEGLRDDLAHAGVRVPQVQCRKGKAFLEIVACSEDLGADLIVLGARGAESPHLFQLGTTVEKVIRKSAKPVMIVHPERPFRLGRVLCPVDCSSASARALTYAIQLTRAFRSRLQVMRVVPLPLAAQRLDLRGVQWAAETERAAVVHCAEEFDNFLGGFDLRELEWEKQVARGDPAQEIIAAALGWRASVVVMGSVGRTGLSHILMGSVSLKVARQLPCSLLIVTQEQVGLDRLQQNIDDINAAYREGQSFLADGFHQEALARFERCLRLDPHFAPALEGKVSAHDHLGHAEQAERCRRQAELIRQELWNQ